MAIFLNIPMHHYWDSAFTNGKLLLAAEKEEANIPSYRIRDIDAEGHVAYETLDGRDYHPHFMASDL